MKVFLPLRATHFSFKEELHFDLFICIVSHTVDANTGDFSNKTHRQLFLLKTGLSAWIGSAKLPVPSPAVTKQARLRSLFRT